MARLANLTIQKWGNNLAFRIPASIARAANFAVGLPVEISFDKTGVLIKPIGSPKLSLAQKLALFDPVKHGGEVMATEPVGKEIF